MDSKDKEIAEQQQQRRKRVSRIKTSIIMTIAIWMAISLLAVVVLGIMVVKLNSRIYKLELQLNNAVSSTVNTTEPVDEGSEVEKADASKQTVVKQLDSKDNVYHEGDARKVYLTFECIPGDNTGVILDTLAKYNVKATFFVTTDTSGKYEEVYRRIVNEGHTIAMDSYSNSYSKIYDTVIY